VDPAAQVSAAVSVPAVAIFSSVRRS
jgi:hypothetical protein